MTTTRDIRQEIIDDAASLGDGLVSVKTESESSNFEKVNDRELCAALRIIQLNGMADDEYGTTDVAGYYALIGPYIFLEVGAGFCYLEEFDSDLSALDKFARIINDYPEH